jgi:DNA polymerase-1
VLGIAFSWQMTHGLRRMPPGDAKGRRLEEFRERVRRCRASARSGHNLKFDTGVLLWHGVPSRAPLFDTMLAHSLIEPEQRHKMDYLAETSSATPRSATRRSSE